MSSYKHSINICFCCYCFCYTQSNLKESEYTSQDSCDAENRTVKIRQMWPMISKVKAYWFTNKALPFLSFSFHVLKDFWSRCPGVKFIMSTWHGRKRNGLGLRAGKDLNSCHYVCLCDKTGPCTNSYYTLGMEMLKSDDWLETSRSAWFKYLVLKKWKMKEAEIIATV